MLLECKSGCKCWRVIGAHAALCLERFGDSDVDSSLDSTPEPLDWAIVEYLCEAAPLSHAEGPHSPNKNCCGFVRRQDAK